MASGAESGGRDGELASLSGSSKVTLPSPQATPGTSPCSFPSLGVVPQPNSDNLSDSQSIRSTKSPGPGPVRVNPWFDKVLLKTPTRQWDRDSAGGSDAEIFDGRAARRQFGRQQPPSRADMEDDVRLLKYTERGRPLRKASITMLDWLLGTHTGQYVGLLVVAAALILTGTVFWIVASWFENCSFDTETEEFYTTFVRSFWMSYSLFIDPGTQTGIESSNCWQLKFVAVVFSFFGFIFNLSVLGIVVEICRGTLERWRKERHTVVVTGHTLVLGWTDRTLFLLKEMLHAASEADAKRQVVVILANRDTVDMKQDLRQSFSRCAGLLRRHRVICVEGYPHELDDLLRVSAGSARDVIVIGGEGRPHDADVQVVRVVAALAALPDGRDLTGMAIAEVQCADTVPVVEALLDNAEGIHTRSAVNRIMCLLAVEPLVGFWYVAMSTYEFGVALFVSSVPPGLAGQTFADACGQCKQAVCVGLKKSSGHTVLAPPDETIIDVGDRLLFMASQRTGEERGARRGNFEFLNSTVVANKPPAAVVQLASHSAAAAANLGKMARSRVVSTVASARNVCGQALVPLPALPFGEPAEDQSASPRASMMRPTKSNGSAKTAATSRSDGRGKPASAGPVYNVIGFPDDFGDIMQTLDGYVPRGTSVHVLSRATKVERERRTQALRLKNMTVVHHPGPATAVRQLAALPIEEACATLVLNEGLQWQGEEANAAADATASDSRSLTCAVTLVSICEGRYGHAPCRPRGRIICEVLDPQTDGVISEVLRKHPVLREMCIFFRSSAITTGLFTLAAHEPHIFNTLVLMLQPGSGVGALACVPVSRYVAEPPEALMSYWDLHRQVRVRGNDLVIGWEDPGMGAMRLAPEVHRHAPLHLGAGGKLLVLRSGVVEPGSPTAGAPTLDLAHSNDARATLM